MICPALKHTDLQVLVVLSRGYTVSYTGHDSIYLWIDLFVAKQVNKLNLLTAFTGG